MIPGGGALRIQRGFLGLQSGHPRSNGCSCFRSFRLAALQGCQGNPGFLQLLGKDLDLCPLGGIALPVGALPVQKGLTLPVS